LGEGRELALDIGGLLCLQLRRAELMVAGTVTGGAWRNPASDIPSKGQANGRIVFAKGMPGLKTLAGKGRQAVGAACELSPDIDRGLRRQAVSARYSNRAGRRRLGPATTSAKERGRCHNSDLVFPIANHRANELCPTVRIRRSRGQLPVHHRRCSRS
jgi:hypothetical protein